MNFIDNLINEERKSDLKKLADKEFEEMGKRFNSEHLTEMEAIYTAMEICKLLARWQEKEKARLVEEVMKKNLENQTKKSKK